MLLASLDSFLQRFSLQIRCPGNRVTPPSIPQADTPAAANGATPGALTLGYYDTDAARTITQNGKSTVYTLDTAGRRSTSTTTSGSTTSTIVRHYTDGSDNPGWTASTDATSSTPTIERMAGGLSGDLGLTIQGDGKVQLAIANLHGDIVSQVTLPTTGNATGIDSWQDADEYGNTIGGTAGITPTNTDGKGLAYGSLGAKERATDTTGLTLMGARIYDSATGQFTSADPVFGGNTASYAYPQDPINGFDLTGSCWSWCNSAYKSVKRATGRVAKNTNWRKVGSVAAYAGGIAAGIACGASVICAVAVGATAAAAGYSAQHYKNKSDPFKTSGVLNAAATGGYTAGVLSVAGRGLTIMNKGFPRHYGRLKPYPRAKPSPTHSSGVYKSWWRGE